MCQGTGIVNSLLAIVHVIKTYATIHVTGGDTSITPFAGQLSYFHRPHFLHFGTLTAGRHLQLQNTG